MKKLISTFLLLTLVSCISNTKITGSWVKGTLPRSYSNVFIAAFIGNAVVKSTVENHVAERLNKNGIRTLKSMEEFPSTFFNDTIDRKTLLALVSETQMESILVITIIKKESDHRYIPGPLVYRPDRYSHNGYFFDYYNYWHLCVYDHGYYLPGEIYYLETNLYDGQTQQLVWSAQSQTYDPINLDVFARNYAIKMFERMKKDKVLKPLLRKGTKTANA
jgi:hypothetical protein